MKARIILVLFFFICLIGNLQAQNVFNRVYDDSLRYDAAFGVNQTIDNGFIVTGQTFNFNTGYAAVWVLKIDYAGNFQWSHDYDLSTLGGDWGQAIIQLKDSNYLITGATYDSVQMKKDAYLLKIDTLGNIIWFKKFGGNNNDSGYDVKQKNDGSLVLSGWSQQANGYEDGYLVKTDSAGNMQWQHNYGGGNSDLIYSVDLTQDGGYILGGRTYSYTMGVDDLYLVKTDSLGNEQWHRNYGTTGDDYGQTAIATLDGGYMLVGGIEVPIGSGNDNGYIVKTDSQGLMQWTKTLGITGYNELFIACRQQSDSNYIVMGGSGYNNYEGWLVKLIPNGDTLFTKKYRYYPDTGTYHPQHYFYNMDITSDGGAVMAGMVINNLLPQKNDFWVVKVDSLGCADTSCVIPTAVPQQTQQVQEGIKVYPNPVKDNRIIIAYTLKQGHFITVSIYDINGREIKTERVFTPGNYHPFYFSDLKAGMYCVRLQDGEKFFTTKFLKE